MGLIEDEEHVEASFTDGANPAFSDGIGVGYLTARTDNCDSFHYESGVKPCRELTISNVDERAQG